MSTEIKVIEKEINPMLLKASKLTIKGVDDMKEATEYLSQLNIAKDRVVDRMETITKPAKEVIKSAEAVWKPFINAVKEAIEDIREKMSDYQTQSILKAREEEAKIANRIGEGKGKLKLETASNKIAEIEKPEAKINVESGSLKFREDQCFEVEDISQLPQEYLLANEIKIRSALKAGIKLKGVRYYTKMVPINTR